MGGVQEPSNILLMKERVSKHDRRCQHDTLVNIGKVSRQVGNIKLPTLVTDKSHV